MNGLGHGIEETVLCLYRTTIKQPLSAMIAGSPGIQTAIYTSLDEAKMIIEKFISKTEGIPLGENK